MIVGTRFASLTNSHGTRFEKTLEQFGAWLRSPIVTADKAGAGGFSLATFRDDRRAKVNVERMHALTFDVDHTAVAAVDGAKICRSCAGWIYTTASHEPSAPRWRAILLLREPLEATQYSDAWNHVAARMAAASVVVDGATRDPSRFWFVPTVRPGHELEHEVHDLAGEPIDVAKLLEVAARSQRRPRVAIASSVPHDSSYIARALDRAAQSVATATNGARNATLNRETHSLARLDVDAGVIASTMREAARAAGLPAIETEKTIASALRARRGAA